VKIWFNYSSLWKKSWHI